MSNTTHFTTRRAFVAAIVWAILGAVYALVPWGDMIGYAWVWGFGSLLFLGLSGMLRWREPSPGARG